MRTALPTLRCATLLTIVMLALGACSGDDGNNGPPGPQGPPGPPGPGAGSINIADATEINATIDEVVIASPPMMRFSLADGTGRPVVGLPASAIGFMIAKLVPGADGNASVWQSYINRIETPGAGPWPGTEDQVQATTENGADGMLVDNGDGSYEYTYATDVANVAGVPYDPTLTHRASFEIRGFVPVLNPNYTFQPSTGATTGIFSRQIVADTSCNACHDQLALHGDGRFTVQTCVVCHNPGSTDAQSTNTVDLKQMIHKIHRGADLHVVQDGGEYAIWGFGNTKHDFSEVEWPQDIRNCRKCHDENNPATPDAANWFNVPTIEACGACHDDVNFETAENHPAGVSVTNSDCTICHGSDSPIRPDRVHVILEREAAKAFQYNIIDITDTAPGETPNVVFSVSDPTNGGALYDIENDEPFVQGSDSTMNIDIAWTTLALNNLGSNSGSASGTPALPIRINVLGGGAMNNGDNTFTAVAGSAIPAGTIGSGLVSIEGHPAADVDSDGSYERLPVIGVTASYAITDATPQDRAKIVDIDRCNVCHERLSLHGNNRTGNIELCRSCHTPDTTDINRRVQYGADSSNSPDGKDEETVDFKPMIHAIHAGGDRTNPLVVYGFSGPEDFSRIEFPGHLNNCENCHLPGTYYPVGASALAATIDTGVDLDSPFDDLNITPNAAACWGCHDRPVAVAHMIGHGGAFDAMQTPEGTLISQSAGTVIETCDVCHGPGRVADVGVHHGVIGSHEE
jgi:OmcA/MtrC family decaheme c-type cytochrome